MASDRLATPKPEDLDREIWLVINRYMRMAESHSEAAKNEIGDACLGFFARYLVQAVIASGGNREWLLKFVAEVWDGLANVEGKE